MNNSQQIDLTQGSISRGIFKMAVPASLGFFFNTLYNIVDTFWAGQLSTEALAALSISFPIFFIIVAFTSGLSRGTTALIASAIGAKKKKLSKIFTAQSIVLALFFSIILTFIGITTSRTLFIGLGAEGVLLDTALGYMETIYLGSVFFALTNCANGILMSTGDTVSFRNFLLMGFVVNLGLDPLLAFGIEGLIPPMGVVGIAWATVCTEALGAIYLLRKVKKTKLISLQDKKLFVPNLSYLSRLLKQSIPSSLSLGTIAVGAYVITRFVGQYGIEALAGFGAAIKIEHSALIPAIGINFATLALVGQNYGAKKPDRIYLSYMTSLGLGALVSVVGTLFLLFLAPHLLCLFTENSQAIEIGISYLCFAAFTQFAHVVIFISEATLQSLQAPIKAMSIGFVKHVCMPPLLLPFFADYLNMGLTGIWWGLFSGNIIMATTAFVMAYTKIKPEFRLRKNNS